MYKVGTAARIIKLLEMPDNTVTAIIQGIRRVKLESLTHSIPYMCGRISMLDEELPMKNDTEFSLLVDMVIEATVNYIKMTGVLPPDSTFALKNIKNPVEVKEMIHSQVEDVKLKRRVRIGEIMGEGLDDDNNLDDDYE